MAKSCIYARHTELSDAGELDVSGPPHPAGIVLRRHGYFTIPSLEELANSTDENGHCDVQDFTIGRENYGNIFFEGPMDISDLNLDELGELYEKLQKLGQLIYILNIFQFIYVTVKSWFTLTTKLSPHWDKASTEKPK